jgi:hypothetical protein
MKAINGRFHLGVGARQRVLMVTGKSKPARIPESTAGKADGQWHVVMASTGHLVYQYPAVGDQPKPPHYASGARHKLCSVMSKVGPQYSAPFSKYSSEGLPLLFH